MLSVVTVAILAMVNISGRLCYPAQQDKKMSLLNNEINKPLYFDKGRNALCINCDVLIRKKRFWWRSEEEEITTFKPTTVKEINLDSVDLSEDDSNSWGSWFSNIGSSIKRGFKKVGRKVKSGVDKIRRSFSRTEDEFNIFIDKLKERVANGDGRAIKLLRKLGIVVKYDENGEASGSEVDSDADDVEETLNKEGMLNPKETITEPTEELTEVFASSTKIPTEDGKHPTDFPTIYKTLRTEILSTFPFISKETIGPTTKIYHNLEATKSASTWTAVPITRSTVTVTEKLTKRVSDTSPVLITFSTSNPENNISAQSSKYTTQSIPITYNSSKLTTDPTLHDASEHIPKSSFSSEESSLSFFSDSSINTSPTLLNHTSIVDTSSNIFNSTLADIITNPKVNSTSINWSKVTDTTISSSINPTIESSKRSTSTETITTNLSKESVSINPQTETSQIYTSTESITTNPTTVSSEIFTETITTNSTSSSGNQTIGTSENSTFIETITTNLSKESTSINPLKETSTLITSTESTTTNPTTVPSEISTKTITTNPTTSSSRNQTIESSEISTLRETITTNLSIESTSINPLKETSKLYTSTERINTNPTTVSSEIHAETISTNPTTLSLRNRTTLPSKTTTELNTVEPLISTNTSIDSTTYSNSYNLTTPSLSEDKTNIASAVLSTDTTESTSIHTSVSTEIAMSTLSTSTSTTELPILENSFSNSPTSTIKTSTISTTTSINFPFSEYSTLPTGPTTQSPFPDIFKETGVRNRLHDVFLNADFNHDDLKNIFEYDPDIYGEGYYYDYI